MTLTSLWKNLWPEAVTERTFENLEPGVSVEEDIVSLGISMGLKDGKDVSELHKKLMTEELHVTHEL